MPAALPLPPDAIARMQMLTRSVKNQQASAKLKDQNRKSDDARKRTS